MKIYPKNNLYPLEVQITFCLERVKVLFDMGLILHEIGQSKSQFLKVDIEANLLLVKSLLSAGFLLHQKAAQFLISKYWDEVENPNKQDDDDVYNEVEGFSLKQVQDILDYYQRRYLQNESNRLSYHCGCYLVTQQVHFGKEGIHVGEGIEQAYLEKILTLFNNEKFSADDFKHPITSALLILNLANPDLDRVLHNVDIKTLSEQLDKTVIKAVMSLSDSTTDLDAFIPRLGLEQQVNSVLMDEMKKVLMNVSKEKKSFFNPFR